MAFGLIKTPFNFGDASEALHAAAKLESSTEEFYQYEINVVFDGERQPVGYQVRVKDLDGFGVAYVYED